MKKANYVLKINDPCNEDWESMKPTAEGRFCSHCSHAVIDFTSLSDNQALTIIEKSNGKLCGRFKESQLNRLMMQTDAVNNNPRLYKILAGLLLLATTGTLLSEPADNNARVMAKSTAPETNQGYTVGRLAYVPVSAGTKDTTISGSIIDNITRKPIPYAVVHLKNSKQSWKADAEGKFTIVLLQKDLPSHITFEISAPGHETLEFTVDKSKLPYKNQFALVKEERILMGDTIFSPQR